MCDFHSHSDLPPLAEDEYVLDTAPVREFIAFVRAQIEQADSARTATELISPGFGSTHDRLRILVASRQNPLGQRLVALRIFLTRREVREISGSGVETVQSV